MKIKIVCPHCGQESEHDIVTFNDSLIELWNNPEDDVWDEK